jgi:hypothetical protein
VTASDGALGEQHLRDFQDDEKSMPTILTTSQKLSTGEEKQGRKGGKKRGRDSQKGRGVARRRNVGEIYESQPLFSTTSVLKRGRGLLTFEKNHGAIYREQESHSDPRLFFSTFRR